MDSLITAAAQALAAGDPLGALNRVALRDDPPALALRGIAMAQLGDRGRLQRLRRPSGQSRRDALGGVAGAAGEASGIPAADGLDVSLGVLA